MVSGSPKSLIRQPVHGSVCEHLLQISCSVHMPKIIHESWWLAVVDKVIAIMKRVFLWLATLYALVSLIPAFVARLVNFPAG